MAKFEKKADKAEKAEKVEKVKKETETFKYGVEDVAESLGIKPASARVQLRNHGIEKSGKSYGWNSKSEVEDVVKTINAGSEKKEKAEKTDKKPAKMKVKEKAAA